MATLIDADNLASYTCKCGIVQTVYPGIHHHTCQYQQPNQSGMNVNLNTTSIESAINSQTIYLYNLTNISNKLNEIVEILKG